MGVTVNYLRSYVTGSNDISQTTVVGVHHGPGGLSGHICGTHCGPAGQRQPRGLD
jgi:hypothetical protein